MGNIAQHQPNINKKSSYLPESLNAAIVKATILPAVRVAATNDRPEKPKTPDPVTNASVTIAIPTIREMIPASLFGSHSH